MGTTNAAPLRAIGSTARNLLFGQELTVRQQLRGPTVPQHASARRCSAARQARGAGTNKPGARPNERLPTGCGALIRRALRQPGVVQVTRRHLMPQGSRMGRTLSMAFDWGGSLQVLCGDLDVADA